MRYTLWDALADIGGFNDGLIILIGTFLSPITATLFHVELYSYLGRDSSKSVKYAIDRDHLA